MLCQLIFQDVKLGQAGQGGSRVQIILATLDMLEVNGDSHEGVTDLADGPYEVSTMGRATWGELLSLLSLMEGSQIITSHCNRPRGCNHIKRAKSFDDQE